MSGAANEARRPVGRPYRPVPSDFVERWPQFGWEAAGEEWRCNNRTIQRWVDQCGRSEMVLARKRYVEAQRAIASRARRQSYAVGRAMTPVVGRKGGPDITSMHNYLFERNNLYADGGHILHRKKIDG